MFIFGENSESTQEKKGDSVKQKETCPHFPIANTQSPSLSPILSHTQNTRMSKGEDQCKVSITEVMWKQTSSGQLLASRDLPSL